MHTVILKIPTSVKSYDNFCDYFSNECHSHAEYINDEANIDVPCPIHAFRCPFNYESCLQVEPDDWFKVIIIDPKPWD